MDTRDLIRETMQTLSRMNGNRRVVLRVDDSMIHTTDEGDQRYLPVMNVEGDTGFYRIPETIRDEVSGYFGALIAPARQIVEEINVENGIDPREARQIVLDTIVRGRRE
jgi:hypothetical protein